MAQICFQHQEIQSQLLFRAQILIIAVSINEHKRSISTTSGSESSKLHNQKSISTKDKHVAVVTKGKSFNEFFGPSILGPSQNIDDISMRNMTSLRTIISEKKIEKFTFMGLKSEKTIGAQSLLLFVSKR